MSSKFNFKRLVPPKPVANAIASNGDEFASLMNLNIARKYISAENEYSEKFLKSFEDLRVNIAQELSYDEEVEFDWVKPQEGTENMQSDDQHIADIEGIQDAHFVDDWLYFLHDGIYYRAAKNIKLSNWRNCDTLEKVFDTNPVSSNLGSLSVSNDHSIFAYILKQNGSEDGELYFSDLRGDRKWLENFTVKNVMNFVWGGNSDSVLYTQLDQHLRPDRVKVCYLDRQNLKSTEIFRESDPKFFVDISTTKMKDFITINSSSRFSSEIHLVDPETLNSSDISNCVRVKCLKKWAENVEYFADYHPGLKKFIIVANIGSEGDRYCVFQAERESPDKWEKLLDIPEPYFLDDLDLFDKYMAIYAKKDGLPFLLSYNFARRSLREISMASQISTVTPGINSNFFSKKFQFICTHAGYRESTFEYDFENDRLEAIRHVKIGSISPHDLKAERMKVSVNSEIDDKPTDVPITMLYHKNNSNLMNLWKQGLYGKTSDSDKADEPNFPKGDLKFLVLNYNTYGIDTMIPFDPIYLPLIRRGWTLVSIHGRGGNAYGPRWYRSGTKHGKQRCLDDINSTLKFLKQENRLENDIKVVGMGTSAGACMLGASLNKNWQLNSDGELTGNLWDGMILQVPFLDPEGSMSDPKLPLTGTEIEEWGDPTADDSIRHLMKSYSPYDTIPKISPDSQNKCKKIPWIMLTAGLKDQRVPYWQPLKFAARFRHRLPNLYSKELTPLIVQTRHDQGHFGDTCEATADDISDWIAFILECTKS